MFEKMKNNREQNNQKGAGCLRIMKAFNQKALI
ncbi:hypothetical protein ES705_24799 [subsurface metagenome]